MCYWFGNWDPGIGLSACSGWGCTSLEGFAMQLMWLTSSSKLQGVANGVSFMPILPPPPLLKWAENGLEGGDVAPYPTRCFFLAWSLLNKTGSVMHVWSAPNVSCTSVLFNGTAWGRNNVRLDCCLLCGWGACVCRLGQWLQSHLGLPDLPLNLNAKVTTKAESGFRLGDAILTNFPAAG